MEINRFQRVIMLTNADATKCAEIHFTPPNISIRFWWFWYHQKAFLIVPKLSKSGGIIDGTKILSLIRQHSHSLAWLLPNLWKYLLESWLTLWQLLFRNKSLGSMNGTEMTSGKRNGNRKILLKIRKVIINIIYWIYFSTAQNIRNLDRNTE
jgi:hypothetical protein